ncbi:MAG TPA: proton-conducting transporter membrane subunit [Methylococcaceae bacterium]|nr:proton-conducting transporter membrane subunit [Methylococcaceae bacterium]
MLAESFPLLSLLVWLPLAAAAGLRFVPEQWTIPIGLGVATAELAVIVALLASFDTDSGAMQFAESGFVLGPLRYALGLDGVSVLFPALSAFLALLALLYGLALGAGRGYVTAVLVYLTALLGLFCATNPWLFWLFAALETGAAAFMLWRFSADTGRSRTAIRFLQFSGSGLLFGLLGTALLPAAGVPPQAAFVLLLCGFFLRLPLFPLHGWFPEAARHGGLAAVAVVLLGGAKTGLYGIVRFILPPFPEALARWHDALSLLAIAGVFYGALMALNQTNFRRMLAFAVVSHTSALLLGILTLNLNGLRGAMLMLLETGLASAGLFLAAELTIMRCGTALLPRLGGVFDTLPALGLMFLIAALSLMAMPGTPGFDAAHLLLDGLLESHGPAMTVALALGNVLTAAFLLGAFQRVFLARRKARRHGPPAPLSLCEHLLAGAVSLALLAGFHTHPWLEHIDDALPPLLEAFLDEPQP